MEGGFESTHVAGFSRKQGERLRDAARLAGDMARETERARALPASLVTCLAEAGCFRMLAPRDVGGLEVPPASMVEVIETVAAGDGAAGWCVMIGATSGILSAFLPKETALRMFANEQTIAAGVFAPSGVAHKVDGGYQVSGRWGFTSGAAHSEWRLGGAVVMDSAAVDAKPCMNPDGSVQMIHVVFAAAQTTTIDTWNVSGLRGTGSHDMVVTNAFVPEERTLNLFTRPKQAGSLYAFPFYGLLALGIAGVALGLARSSLAAFREVLLTKKPAGSKRTLSEKESMQEKFALAEASYLSARAFLMSSIAGASAEIEQATVLDGFEVSMHARARVRLAATDAVRKCAEAIDTAYTACGMTSVFDSCVLQRNFRDIHVITQHFMVNDATLASAGRALLGLPVAALSL
jgi:indole-3-acetate monooxygenase